jgi:tyrosyl-tRNA synthetase
MGNVNMKTITDEKKIERVLTRGVEQILDEKEKFKKLLMSGKQIKLYCGYDPTAPSLHIGNAISIKKLGEFQKLGHKVIFLIGDFTTLIGDPTDKEATRPKLTREEILKNCKNYQKQASAFLDFEGDNAVEVRYNSEWSDKMSFRDLIELSSNFTVQQMMQRDMFQKRIEEEKPIYLHEFLYPLAQAQDSVAMDVDLEIGGNDQLFNMMRGRELQRTINNREKFVMTLKILADDTGKKMGKSEGNAVFLDQSPENIYGAIMSWPDGFIANTFELMTDVSMDEIEKMREDMKNDAVNPKDLKMRLAKEITEKFHGKEQSDKAEQDFVNKFQKKDLSMDVSELKVEKENSLVQILVENGLAESNSDAKRKIQQGGVSVDGEKIELGAEISDDWNGKILKVGKKDFRKIKIV